MQHPLTAAIETYIRQRADARLEKLDKEQKKQQQAGVSDSELSLARQQELERFSPPVWLTDAASRAGQIKLVTHALKYTHGDAKGSSIYSDAENDSRMPYLCTTSLPDRAIDITGNAAALDIAGLLKLSAGGQTLYQCLANKDASALTAFAESDEQLNEWLQGFSRVFEVTDPSSHRLAKQVFFPVEGNTYHLLGALFSSSLVQAVHERIIHHRFSEESKHLREQRKKGLYANQPTIDFPGMAVQSFGGTKPQNVSQLNSLRGGKTFLFNAQPPAWQNQLKPPMTRFAFWRRYTRQALPTVKRLVKLLRSAKDFNNMEIRNRRANYVDALIEMFVLTGASIRALPNPGWSVESHISDTEKYWLDPDCPDVEFQQAREQSEWLDDLANQFAHWLNRQLRYYGFNVAAPEHGVWKREAKDALRKELEGFGQ
ncbi:type I-F CRISPR-associated protein Csy1 [Gynuella sunshinyii]|uniref:CRISPR-associated protein, Csy1 family n=1 Tax=Gynuella sunshinyii YC6258 TaxID=1445510 RepID=A0A0C5VQY8_9GAMM|nr:type I-F CRISPR-associated protein Csy1 [Gynuella sunshinyii]AJQ97037.1 hypothetical Protein YC6258_05005 [Gynuella sunshinyii YC6258]